MALRHWTGSAACVSLRFFYFIFFTTEDFWRKMAKEQKPQLPLKTALTVLDLKHLDTKYSVTSSAHSVGSQTFGHEILHNKHPLFLFFFLFYKCYCILDIWRSYTLRSHLPEMGLRPQLLARLDDGWTPETKQLSLEVQNGPRDALATDPWGT